MNLKSRILVALFAAIVQVACGEPRAGKSPRVVRLAGTGDERLLLHRSSRQVLPKVRSQALALPGGERCSMQVSFANPDPARLAIFVAAAADAKGEARLFEHPVQLDDAWVDETVELPAGAREVRLSIDGEAQASGVWSAPVVTCLGAAKPAPNVVLLSLDTLRADRLGAYGGPPSLMPNLNAIAARGTLFENAYSQYPQTLGSHATLMTSLYPSEHGVVLKEKGEPRSKRLASSVESLAGVFARNGYATAAFTENAYVGSSFGFDSGFDEYHDGPAVVVGKGFPGNAAETFDRAVAWLRKRSPAPFFLFLHTYEVHTPYAPARAQLDSVLPLHAGIRPEGRPATYEEVLSFSHNKRMSTLDADAVEWARTLYDAEAASLDSALGRLFDRLKELGLDKNTIVVLFSDHGEEFVEHGLMGHGHSLHEETLRVPLIVLERDSSAGKLVREPVGLIDVGPTVLEAAGIGDGFRKPSGRSLLPAIRGVAGSPPTPVYSEMNASYTACPATKDSGMDNCHHELVSVRDGSWSCIADVAAGTEELYSMKNDRAEQSDVAAKEQDAARTCRERIAEFRKRVRPAAAAAAAIDPEAESKLKALGYLQ